MKRAISLCLVALVVGAVPAFAADDDCKPVVGHFEAVVVPPGQDHCPGTAPLCTAGRVWGGIQGNYQFVMTAAGTTAGDYLGTLCTP